MPVVTAKDIIKVEVPDNLHESLVIRCVDVEFGESKSSGQPLITSSWEIVGRKNKDGGIDDNIVIGEKKYVIAGLSLNKVYHSLSLKAIRRHQEFWSKATGKPEEEYSIDTENPDTSYYKGLVMSAVCKAETRQKTKPLTDEEKESLKAAGKPLVGEAVVDDDGNPVYTKFVSVDQFNRRFNGDLPQFA